MYVIMSRGGTVGPALLSSNRSFVDLPAQWPQQRPYDIMRSHEVVWSLFQKDSGEDCHH